jgi:predicted RNase H-like nuclease
MVRTENAVGVDACPYGWFATVLTGAQIETELYEDFSDVYTDNQESRIFVDIPVGLPTSSRRRCDIEARELLGCRGSSVFFPPCESAADIDDYDKANEEHRKEMGHGLSQQAHAISEKINEVQAVVDETGDGRIYEGHPELCFYAFNGQPVAYSKSSKRGLAFRRQLLEQKHSGIDDEYNEILDDTLRKHVRKDDILDAMVLALAAQSEELWSVPDNPGPEAPRIYYPATPALAERPWSNR